MKTLFATAIIGIGLVASSAVQAGGGTISFVGRITPGTCAINTGNVMATAQAGQKEFAVELAGCGGEGTRVSARVQPTRALPSSGEVRLDSSSTNDVQIAVYEAGSKKAKAGAASSAPRTSGMGPAPRDYSVMYVASNATNSGKMAKAAIYTVYYQ